MFIYILSLFIYVTNLCNGSMVTVDETGRTDLGFAWVLSIDTTTTLTIALNLSHPLDGNWCGVGFGSRTMDSARAIVILGDLTYGEYDLEQHGATLDTDTDNSEWTYVSDVASDGFHIFQFSRGINDNVFNPSIFTGINAIYARGQGATIAFHGSYNYRSGHFEEDEDYDMTSSTTAEPISPTSTTALVDEGCWDIDEIRGNLEAEFDGSGFLEPLMATTVRLIFHDCGGPTLDTNSDAICNGCIDFDNGDHAFLEDNAVAQLEVLYQEILVDIADVDNCELSRADYWAMAATIAVQYAQEKDEAVLNDDIQSIPFYTGRVDCDRDAVQAAGDVNAAQKLNPKIMPNALGSFQDAALWFADEMGFTEEEVVALLGVHTLGRTHFSGSGFTTTFWVISWNQLDNDFYKKLAASNWAQSNGGSATGNFQWSSNTNAMMLNPDMGMYYDLDMVDLNSTTNGWADCAVPACNDFMCSTSELCIRNNRTADLVDQFADDLVFWLEEFANIFEKLIMVGYDNLTVVDVGVGSSTSTPGAISTTGTTEEPMIDGANQVFNKVIVYMFVIISIIFIL